jgi:hypothetical protein
MPIRDCQFPYFHSDYCLSLPIKIINPHTNKSYRTNGIVDTGASQCFMPARLAKLLGHNLCAGQKGTTLTGGGQTSTFIHTFTIEIYHPKDPNKTIVWTLDNVLINCVETLPDMLLGVKDFLSNFTLYINYPKRTFSLIH